MARANLNISKSLLDSFHSANESTSTIRAVRISILNEDIVLAATLPITSTADSDFNSKLVGFLPENDAVIILFRLSNKADDPNQKWLLIAWVPDSSKVRDKMLYSSSREDVKKGLGLSLFVTPDFHASSFNDITWNNYNIQSSSSSNNDDILTRKEKALIEEDLLTHNERLQLGTKSTAMGVVPFTLSPDVSKCFREFIIGDKINWIEMSVINEVVHLEKSKMLNIKDQLQEHINPNHAR